MIRTYAGFAAFGAFWGAWGAAVPAVREQAGLTDGQLGTALLFVGVGALPAMLGTGWLVDRWGHRVTAWLLLALGAAGFAVALTGRGFVSLSVGLTVLGAASGAADVAINAEAGAAERAVSRPVITRAHGVFSAGVIVLSLTTGALLDAGAALVVPFMLVAALSAVAGFVTFVMVRSTSHEPLADESSHASRGAWNQVTALRLWPLLVVGGLGALAFAVENAHQSWSAVFLGDVLAAGPAVAAAGPAVFAAVVAVTRFAAAALDPRHGIVVVIAGASAAAAGTVVVAIAPNVALALAGLGLAAAGTAVLYPTLLSLGMARVEEPARGTATSVVATTAYLGFLAGPAYVGGWSAAVGLPGAMLAVAAIAGALALLAWPGLRFGTAGTR